MPGPLNASPAKIISKILIDLNLGSEPDQSTLTQTLAWPCYFNKEPDGKGVPDDVITVFNTTGIEDGRDAFGERADFQGIQVRVRSAKQEEGFLKMDAIRIAFDRLYMKGITLGSDHYTVQSIKRTGGVNPIGKETAPTARNVYTLNAIVTVRMSS